MLKTRDSAAGGEKGKGGKAVSRSGLRLGL